MSNVDRIVDVTITRQSSAVPTMASFSGLLIAAEFLKATPIPDFGTTERVREYSDLAEVLAAGFDEDTFVYKAAAAVFSQAVALDRVYVGRKLTGADGTETWTEALAAMALENPNWYGLIAETRTEATQQLVAAWVEANKKLCVLASADADILDSAYSAETPAEIASYVKAHAYERTGVIYHPDAGDADDEPCPDAAWMGLMFTKDPGAATWMFKTLRGVTPYTLTGARWTNVDAKNANVYTEVAGVSMTQRGTAGSGEYLDVMHGIDWLTARIQNKVFTPLVQQDKVPFTNSGVEVVVNSLKSALQEAVDIGLLASYEVSAPDVADVDAEDKAARTLPDVTFTAILAGAIHKTQINGVVTV